MGRVGLAFAFLWCVVSATSGADVLPGADQRFASGSVQEVPDFQRHVIPLLGRLGCNGRACHGSFQGQGGFRLSLFGYDFQADHAALTGGDQPRVNPEQPAESLVLLKPTETIAHEGGQRFEPGSWESHLIRRWIEAGAQPVQEAAAEFVSLDIEPQEVVFDALGQTAKIRALAQWSDGTREDVTPLCRFRTNDESVATVSEAGVVTAAGKGDTHVVVFYDNGVAPMQIILPLSDRTADRYPEVPAPTRIDELVLAKLRKLGIVPSELCTDAEFLRRVSLDMTGTLPTSAEVRHFLADPSPDKRRRKIDKLLERPTYAAWWTTRLCDLTGNSEATGPLGGEQALNHDKAAQWYDWINRRVRDNVPYDELVAGIVLAVSRQPGQTYDEYCAEMSAYFRTAAPADFSARETMPHFWSRRSVGKPEDKALSFAHAFLGLSLQCAQCHKHPYDQWTKQDFDQFSAFFTGVRFGESDRTRTREMLATVELTGDQDSGDFKRKFLSLVKAGEVLPFKEVSVPQRSRNSSRSKGAKNSKLGRVITPKLLGGEEVIAAEFDDPRQPLMDWIRQDDNPYFARAFVNRVWANYFCCGIIEPTDDQNLANPPSNPVLLDYLTESFVTSGYDMKWLHREITQSNTYQRSWLANDTNRLDERNFSRAVIRRLPAEVLYDSVQLAAASDEQRRNMDQDPIHTRAIGVASGFAGRSSNNYAVSLFGKPPRAVNCDCERSNEPSLLQTVYLRNDQEVQQLLRAKNGWIQQVSEANADDLGDLIAEVYLRTLGRFPNPAQRELAATHLAQATNRTEGLRELLWALVNSKEFVVNH